MTEKLAELFDENAAEPEPRRAPRGGDCIRQLRHRRRCAAACICLRLLLARAGMRRSAAPEPPGRIEIKCEADRDVSSPRDPARKRFGALEFRGGLELSSPHKEFGGLSGDPGRRRRREFRRGDRQGALAARPHRLSRRRAGRHRRCRDRADARPATGARSRRADGTTPRRSPRTAARSMSASSACTRS